MLASGVELELVGFAVALLLLVHLFYPLGRNSVLVGTIVALSDHQAFIPIAKARGPQPEFLLARWNRRRRWGAVRTLQQARKLPAPRLIGIDDDKPCGV